MAVTALFDSHVHSDNSPDGNHSITYLGIHAQELGLTGFAVTDHCECNAYYSDKYDKSIFQSVFETQKAKRIFGDTLKISTGLELGQPLQDLNVSKKAVGNLPFDFILCSVHNLPGKEDFYFLDYGAMDETTVHELLSVYFNHLLETARECDFDSLAHLTYPLRYIVGEHGFPVELSRYSGPVDQILQTLVSRGKALELNTSGLRQPYGVTLPDIAVLKRFKELGGQYVTLGSDAHYSKDLATGFQEGVSLLRKAGFTHYAYYEKRAPKLLPILEQP